MAAIPLPERGQPLDVNFLYEIANQINTLNNAVSQNINSSSQVKDVSNRPTSSINIYAQEVPVPDGNRTAGSTYDVTVTFGVKFQYPPVVLATVLTRDQSAASKNVILYVKDVVTSTCTVGVRYNEAGQSSISINVLAIGIPA